MSENGPLKILLLAAEVVPFAKTGGLADVAGSLPKAIRALGHDVRVAMPRYGRIDPGKFQLREVLAAFDVPMIMHATEPVGHAYPGKTSMTLKELYGFLTAFSSNKIVLAHWGGGLFFYHLMKKEVKSILQNIWFDTAASPYLYDRDIFPLAARIVGPEKILFGSDFPLLKPGRYFKEMKEAGLPKDSLDKICGNNAASLLKIRP